ncbi:MAG: hypothetical protein JXJ04_13315 [Spirochaetales bacterium]|nr:hypothetical protein [Spirochaetales bacterium]
MENHMLGILFAFLTIISWGSWLVPSHTIPFKNQQIKTFYIAVSNLFLALVVGIFQGFHNLTLESFWFPFAGGLIWSVSGYFAFLGTNRIGIAKAIGIWAPLNIIVSIAWGILLFGEFLQTGGMGIILAVISVFAIICGIILIIMAKESPGGKSTIPGNRLRNTGIAGAIIAGILWGSYFIPIRLSSISMWVAAFPLAVGIFTGSVILVLFTGKSIALEKPSYYVRVSISGILWGIGNFTSLRMMELIGTGKGFTIAQLNVVVAAVFGIFLFKKPPPRSKAAVLTLAGIAIAVSGSIMLGSLK